MAPEISFVASAVRSVRVSNGDSRLRNSSVFFGLDLAKLRPSCEFLFILEDSTSFNGDIERARVFALQLWLGMFGFAAISFADH